VCASFARWAAAVGFGLVTAAASGCGEIYAHNDFHHKLGQWQFSYSWTLDVGSKASIAARDTELRLSRTSH